MQIAKKTQQKMSKFFSQEQVPDELRALSDEMQEKAVHMANALTEQGYQLRAAGSMALERVRHLSGMSDETPAQHVLPHDEGWAVMRADAERATALFPTKKEAMDRGREIARNQQSKLVIHGEDGAVQEEHTYSKA